MITKQIIGGWYCDLTLEGDYGAVIGDKGILINKETIPEVGVDYLNPGARINNLLFFRLHRFSNLFFAGKGHQDGRAWVRNTLENSYHDLGPTHGNSPIAFWREFVFVVSSGIRCDVYFLKNFERVRTIIDDKIGSQGIRYIDANGTPIWGDATYSGKHAEYTLLADVSIGQSYIGGASLIYTQNGREVRKTLEPGDTTFIRAYRNFDSLGSAIVKPGLARFLWFDINEMDSFPNEFASQPIPTPVPEIPKMQLPNRSSLLSSIWNAWNQQRPITDETEKHAFTEAFVKVLNGDDGSLRWGRKSRASHGGPLSKDTIAYWIGSSIPTIPTDGEGYAIDLISGSTGNVGWSPYPGTSLLMWYPITGSGFIPKPESTNTTDWDDKIQQLFSKIVKLENKIQRLEDMALVDGSIVGLRTENGYFLTAESNGGLSREQQPVSFNRTELNGWEKLKLIKG